MSGGMQAMTEAFLIACRALGLLTGVPVHLPHR